MAEQLELERIGPQHQAGSDSLLTGMAFFKMREVGFKAVCGYKCVWGGFYAVNVYMLCMAKTSARIE